MNWFGHGNYQPPSLMDRMFSSLFAGLFALVAIGFAIELFIKFIVPLLPFIGFVLMLGMGVRWWLYRSSSW